MENQLSHNDLLHFQRAIELALEAEQEGNLPIGCVISFNDRNVAEGKNAMWVPEFNPIRHAEIEALENVPRELWENSRKITLYSTLEPCLMCTAAILQHSIGKVLYGSSDGYGGSGSVFGKMPLYFEEELTSVQWLGPVFPEECDPLYQRAIDVIEKRRSSTE
jgi:tRNA(Arg) A34 adenosine deaminase TadA